MSECRIWPGRTEFRQDDRESGVLFVPTRDACLAGRGQNGIGGSGAQPIMPRFWDSPSVDVVSVHTLATLPLAPPFVPPAARVANACEAVPYRPTTASANREVPATPAGKDLKI